MTALFSAGWSGMGIINDLDRGVMDRFLVSPARRASLIAAARWASSPSSSPSSP